MTPARKKALQWFYDRGEVTRFFLADSPPSDRMMARMIRDGMLEKRSRGNMKLMAYTLTDKGRRALHGDANRYLFHELMRLRREYTCGGSGHDLYSKLARRIYWIMRGVPVMEWKE